MDNLGNVLATRATQVLATVERTRSFASLRFFLVKENIEQRTKTKHNVAEQNQNDRIFKPVALHPGAMQRSSRYLETFVNISMIFGTFKRG